MDIKVDERIKNFKPDYSKRENEFFYFSPKSEVCINSYKKVTLDKYNYLKNLFNKEKSKFSTTDDKAESEFGHDFIIDDTDETIKKLYRNIMNDEYFLKKNKYIKLSKKNKISGRPNKIITLAVYFNYEDELRKLTKNLLNNEIDIKAWAWVSSDRDMEFIDIFSYAMGGMNTEALAKCYKRALKLKLEGGDCIIVDARKPTGGDYMNPTITRNLLFYERDTRTLSSGYKSKTLINKIAKETENNKKKEKEILIKKEAKKKEEKKKVLDKKNELKEINKKLSLFDESEIVKSQKIINYTKKFIELNPDEFDILEIAKKILNVKKILEGEINKENLKKLIELQEYTAKSDKFRDYEKKIIEKDKDLKIKKVDTEIKALNEKVEISKKYLTKNIDSIYAADLVQLISISEKTISDPQKLSDIQKRTNDLDILLTKIDSLNEKIKIANDLNLQLKEKLKKSLSTDLAPKLVEQIEKIESVLKNMDVNLLDRLIVEANEFVDNEIKDVEKKINDTVKTIDKTKVKEKITKSLGKTKVKEKITKSLDKTLGKLSKDIDLKNQNILDLENKTSKKKKSNKDNSNKKKTNKNKSDFLKLRTAEYLTIEAFKRDFNNKTVFLKKDSYNSQDQIVFKVNIKQLANGSNYETAGVETDIYYTIKNKWEKQKIKIYYFEDVYTCDPNARNSCEPGAISLYLDVFDYSYGITYEKERSIGNTITSPAGYKLVPLYEVVEGDRSYNPNEYRVISPNRRNEAEYAVIKLSKDDSYIAELDNSIQSSEVASKVAKEKKQKKDNKAKAKQKGFKEKISLSCTYVGGAGSRTANYQFGLGDDGKGLSFEGIPAELGVEINDNSNGDEMYFLATRVGKQNIKAKLITSGIQVDYELDLKNLKAVSEVMGQVVMAQCMKF